MHFGMGKVPKAPTATRFKIFSQFFSVGRDAGACVLAKTCPSAGLWPQALFFGSNPFLGWPIAAGAFFLFSKNTSLGWPIAAGVFFFLPN